MLASRISVCKPAPSSVAKYMKILLKLLGILTVIGIFAVFQPVPVAIWFGAGVVLGSFFTMIDYVLFTWYGDDQDPMVQTGSWYLSQKKWFGYLGWSLTSQDQPRQLLSRSIVLTATVLVLTVYATTSSDAMFGIGFLFGWHLHALSDWWTWSRQPGLLWSQIGWQLAWQPTQSQLRYLLLGYTGGVLGLFGLFFI